MGSSVTDPVYKHARKVLNASAWIHLYDYISLICVYDLNKQLNFHSELAFNTLSVIILDL